MDKTESVRTSLTILESDSHLRALNLDLDRYRAPVEPRREAQTVLQVPIVIQRDRVILIVRVRQNQ